MDEMKVASSVGRIVEWSVEKTAEWMIEKKAVKLVWMKAELTGYTKVVA